jgi:hypothetical protein
MCRTTPILLSGRDTCFKVGLFRFADVRLSGAIAAKKRRPTRFRTPPDTQIRPFSITLRSTTALPAAATPSSTLSTLRPPTLGSIALAGRPADPRANVSR